MYFYFVVNPHFFNSHQGHLQIVNIRVLLTILYQVHHKPRNPTQGYALDMKIKACVPCKQVCPSHHQNQAYKGFIKYPITMTCLTKDPNQHKIISTTSRVQGPLIFQAWVQELLQRILHQEICFMVFFNHLNHTRGPQRVKIQHVIICGVPKPSSRVS